MFSFQGLLSIELCFPFFLNIFAFFLLSQVCSFLLKGTSKRKFSHGNKSKELEKKRLLDKLRTLKEIAFRFPGVLFFGIAGPFHQIQKSTLQAHKKQAFFLKKKKEMAAVRVGA